MKQFLHDIGLGDGEGNTSSTRVINLLAAMVWLASKFYNAHLTDRPITWDSSDLEILGVIGGISIGKTAMENKTPVKPPGQP